MLRYFYLGMILPRPPGQAASPAMGVIHKGVIAYTALGLGLLINIIGRNWGNMILNWLVPILNLP
jgi:hypothetical protein